MSSSESDAPGASENAEAAAHEESEVQRAADSLKGQIAALRAKVKTAQDHLRPRREREPRSFED